MSGEISGLRPIPSARLLELATGLLAALRDAGGYIEDPSFFRPSAVRRRALRLAYEMNRPINRTWSSAALAYVDDDRTGTRRRVAADFRERYPNMLDRAAAMVRSLHQHGIEKAARREREDLILATMAPPPAWVRDAREEILVINCCDEASPVEKLRLAELDARITEDSKLRRADAEKMLGAA